MVSNRIVLILLLLFSALASSAQYTSDTKDEQVARRKMRVGTDTSKYWQVLVNTIDSNATHRQAITAKSVWDLFSDLSSSITTDSTLAGAGTVGSPLKIAQQSATNGQVLKWDNTAARWKPGSDLGTTYTGGTGINVTGTVISNTGDLSNTNEIQSLSLAGQALGITGGGTGINLPVIALTGGSGISVNNVTGNVTVTNTGDLSNTNEIELPSQTGNGGKVLSTNGTVPSWITAATGTVTSVGLTMPGIFSVAGTPLTTNGTLAVGLFTQNANRVWAGPTSGGAATPTFRALVAADIPSLLSGTSGQIPYFNSSTTITTESGSGANAFSWDATNNRLGIGTTTPGTAIEITGDAGLKLPESSTALGERILYWDNKDLLKFGTDRTIEKATVWNALISQNVVWNAGDYWDCASVPFMEFGSVRISMESSGGAHGTFREYNIPLSYANDTWTNDYGAPSINDTWVILSETAQYSRSWGDNFVANFKLAHKVNNGTHYFRLVCITTGEIRGAPFDYGNASVRVKFYFSDNVTLSKTGAWASLILSTTGTGMTVPTIIVPSVKSGKASRSIYRNALTIGDGFKNVTTPPSNGLLVEGSVGIGTNSITSRLEVKGSGSTSGSNIALFENSLGNDALTIKGDRSVTFNNLSGTGNRLMQLDLDGVATRSSLDPGTLVTGNIYTINGTLAGNRTVTHGSNILTFDASTSGSTVSTPIIIKGKADGTNSTQALTIQNAAGNPLATITSTNTSTTIAAISTYKLLVGAGSNVHEYNDAGYIKYVGLSVDPTVTNQLGAFWFNTTSTRLKYNKTNSGTTLRQLANVEDDVVGTSIVSTSSAYTLTGTVFRVQADANTNAITITVDGTMQEGYTYLVRCRRNGTNAITISAGAGYVLAVDGDSALTPSTYTCTAYEVIKITRYDTVVFVDK